MTISSSKAVIRNFSKHLDRMGFGKIVPEFVADEKQSYCTLVKAWTSIGEPIWIEAYVGPYFGATRTIWVGLVAKEKSVFRPILNSIDKVVPTLSYDDWDGYDINTPAKRNALAAHSYLALEQYQAHQYVWIGRYFEETASTAEDCFNLIQAWFGQLGVKLRRPAKRKVPELTAKEVTTFIRLTQGAFRDDVSELWNYKCAVTDLDFRPALRASHILPWSDFPEHRTDPHNGLLLNAIYDALFDGGFISFEDDGKIKISQQLPSSWRVKLDVKNTDRLRDIPHPKVRWFLRRHRQLIFLRD